MKKAPIALASMVLASSVAGVQLSCSDKDGPATDAGGAGGEGGGASGDPGALIEISTKSQVGVLLDELPESMRDRVAAQLLDEPESFFIDRAKRQLGLATYRLNFRPAFYDEEDAKQQLPLPPEAVFDIQLLPDEEGKTIRREEIDGHDFVLADFTFKAVVVTDAESPETSEPALARVGGSWDEPFVFPVDPEMLFQRTGYACMDEAEFPPNSVDSEDVEFFYDQTCEVESELTPDGCHFTELPFEDCEEALSAHTGKIEAPFHYERLAWDEKVAAANRVGKVETEGAADLQVVTEELKVNRLTYRYIADNSCALAEACVGGTGWRRLLQFNASEKNVGTEAINIGNVDYFVDNPDVATPNANHHLYEFSACHHHYHFNYFATFTYGDDPDLGSKRAFCLESVARYSNHERSPTWSPYNGCGYQGITPGWGDQYNAGIECQWVDVTTVSVEDGPVTKALGLRSNPAGFLCEGVPEFDEEGNVVWEATDIENSEGLTVDRPVCEEADDWDGNNYGEQDVVLPVLGEGMVTSPCERGQIGPLRNCGYAYDGNVSSCTAGENTTVSCVLEAGAEPQVVRLCEASLVLGAGTACTERDALGSAVLEGEAAVSITFKCPAERDATEPGGQYSLYVGAAWPGDELAGVTCTPE